MEDSLRVVDAILRVEAPAGPCWRRYNNDGYGQRADGGPFDGLGGGTGVAPAHRRARPLRAGRGERRRALRQGDGGLRLARGHAPEQIWDAADIPGDELFFGRPTGSAMPLMWAHAEYVKLLRSVRDGVVFDRVAAVADRYLPGRGRKDLEIWKFSRGRAPCRRAPRCASRTRPPSASAGAWSDWRTSTDSASRTTALGIHNADVVVPEGQRPRFDSPSSGPRPAGGRKGTSRSTSGKRADESRPEGLQLRAAGATGSPSVTFSSWRPPSSDSAMARGSTGEPSSTARATPRERCSGLTTSIA